MSTLNFPTSPSLNDTYTFGTKTWTWTGAAWRLSTSAAINNIVIGNVTPSTGAFTTITGNTAVIPVITVNQLASDDSSFVSVADGLYVQGEVLASGNITGAYFVGNGSQLTGLPESGLSWTTQANAAPDSPSPGDFWYDAYTGVKYQYINDGTSNIWVDQSYPSSFSTLAVVANATVGGELAVTGNASISGDLSVSGNITGTYLFGNASQLTDIPETYSNANVAAYLPTYSGNITGGNLVVIGLVSTSSITKTGASNVGNIGSAANRFGNIFGSYFIGNGSQLTGLPASYSDANVAAYLPTYTGNLDSLTGNVTTTADISGGNVTVTGNLAGGNVTVTGNLAGGNVTVTGVASVSAIDKTGSNGVGNIGSSSSTFDTVFAKATSAQYADLAEIYSADQDYQPGTVLVFGGTHEVTVSDISHDIRAAGVVSTQPAHVMNSDSQGVAVALTGRVPCRVRGPVAKGEQLVNIEPGIAGAVDFAQYRPGCVIGKSLETIVDSGVHTIEIAVGRY